MREEGGTLLKSQVEETQSVSCRLQFTSTSPLTRPGHNACQHKELCCLEKPGGRGSNSQRILRVCLPHSRLPDQSRWPACRQQQQVTHTSH